MVSGVHHHHGVRRKFFGTVVPLLVVFGPIGASCWVMQLSSSFQQHRWGYLQPPLLFGKNGDDNDGVSSDERRFCCRPIQLLPVSLNVSQVSVEYHPPAVVSSSWWTRRLFSSVPRRKFALQNITLQVPHPKLLVVTGDSSAGKSTFLRVIAAANHPRATAAAATDSMIGTARTTTSGQVQLTTTTTATQSSSSSSSSAVVPVPIYLDASTDAPEYTYSGRGDETVRDLVRERLKTTTKTTTLSKESQEYLARVMIGIFMNDQNENDAQVVSSWSQSRLYRMRLLEACLDSVARQTTTATTTTTVVVAAAPVLLLDEWLDRETSSVIQSVQRSLERLVLELGAMVCVVTHYPERWKNLVLSTTTTDAAGGGSSSSTTTQQVILSMGRQQEQNYSY